MRENKLLSSEQTEWSFLNQHEVYTSPLSSSLFLAVSHAHNKEISLPLNI